VPYDRVSQKRIVRDQSSSCFRVELRCRTAHRGTPRAASCFFLDLVFSDPVFAWEPGSATCPGVVRAYPPGLDVQRSARYVRVTVACHVASSLQARVGEPWLSHFIRQRFQCRLEAPPTGGAMLRAARKSRRASEYSAPHQRTMPIEAATACSPVANT
jgi:hypothetical protein